MCLAIPGKVIGKDGCFGEVEVMGVKQRINTQLIGNLKIGDSVLVHGGFAIEKIDLSYSTFLEEQYEKYLRYEEND